MDQFCFFLSIFPKFHFKSFWNDSSMIWFSQCSPILMNLSHMKKVAHPTVGFTFDGQGFNSRRSYQFLGMNSPARKWCEACLEQAQMPHRLHSNRTLFNPQLSSQHTVCEQAKVARTADFYFQLPDYHGYHHHVRPEPRRGSPWELSRSAIPVRNVALQFLFHQKR